MGSRYPRTIMTIVSRFRILQPLPGVVLAFTALVLAGIVRRHFVEPDLLGLACQTGNPWWCTPRTLFIMFSQWNGYGWASIMFAALAALWLLRGRDPMLFAMVALGFGGAGLALYNVTFSCVAVVVAVLILTQRRVQVVAVDDAGSVSVLRFLYDSLTT